MSSSRPHRRAIAGATRLIRAGSGAGERSAGDRTPAGPHYRVIEHHGLRWIDIPRPTPADIAYLQDEFEFHPLALDDVMSRTQRPKLDVYDDCLFVVMHFPVFNRASRITTASEVDIFVGSDFVVTTHDGVLPPIVRMFDEVTTSEASRDSLMGKTSAHLLYYIVDRLVDYCFPIVSKVTDRIEAIEDVIFDRANLSTVQEISIVRRDLIAMRRIIKPQLPIASQLEHRDLPVIQDDIEVYFGDIADHLAKIWDSLEDLKEVIDGLSDTFDSLASHRLNEVIKTLTVISVIILPMTLITGIFGMNVPLPYEGSPYAIAIISSALISVTVAMLIAFRSRGWI
jgi:magnesium transporter